MNSMNPLVIDSHTYIVPTRITDLIQLMPLSHQQAARTTEVPNTPHTAPCQPSIKWRGREKGRERGREEERERERERGRESDM